MDPILLEMSTTCSGKTTQDRSADNCLQASTGMFLGGSCPDISGPATPICLVGTNDCMSHTLHVKYTSRRDHHVDPLNLEGVAGLASSLIRPTHSAHLAALLQVLSQGLDHEQWPDSIDVKVDPEALGVQVAQLVIVLVACH